MFPFILRDLHGMEGGCVCIAFCKCSFFGMFSCLEFAACGASDAFWFARCHSFVGGFQISNHDCSRAKLWQRCFDHLHAGVVFHG